MPSPETKTNTRPVRIQALLRRMGESGLGWDANDFKEAQKLSSRLKQGSKARQNLETAIEKNSPIFGREAKSLPHIERPIYLDEPDDIELEKWEISEIPNLILLLPSEFSLSPNQIELLDDFVERVFIIPPDPDRLFRHLNRLIKSQRKSIVVVCPFSTEDGLSIPHQLSIYLSVVEEEEFPNELFFVGLDHWGLHPSVLEEDFRRDLGHHGDRFLGVLSRKEAKGEKVGSEMVRNLIALIEEYSPSSSSPQA